MGRAQDGSHGRPPDSHRRHCRYYLGPLLSGTWWASDWGGVSPPEDWYSIGIHLGHPSHSIEPAIPAAVFLSSLLFLGAGIYLERRPDVASVYADAGLGAGVLSFIAALALLVV